MNELLNDFIKVAELASLTVTIDDFKIEKLNIKSHNLQRLPQNKMAIYVFYYNQDCLKVGKVGVNSNARFQNHHYNPNSSKSNLAKSILNDYDLNENLDLDNVGNWIKENTIRWNIFIDSTKGIFVLNLLEAFIHARLKPKYEGFQTQR